MRRLFLLLLVLFVTFGCATSGGAKTDERSAEELALELIEITGSAANATQMMETMTTHLKGMFPTVPDAYWEELAKLMEDDELTSLIVPVYVKHYPREDLIALIEFYRTPLGQRVVERTPIVMQEGYVIGATWGRQKGEEIIRKLRSDGYEPQQI